MFRFFPLASGSKGNAIFVDTGKTKLLFDCGISMRAIQKRLESINASIDEIDAIIISHEHTDHIRSVETVSNKFNIPVLANVETAKAICSHAKVRPEFKIFSTGETFEFGEVAIHPFSIQHDTLDPVAFTLEIGPYKIGICTDLGFATTLVKSHLRNCDLLYLESNHEVSMVHASPRPMIYKQRVLWRQGHLSNDAAAELLTEVLHDKLLYVYLAHLSEECNNPDVALKKAQDVLKGSQAQVSIAHQKEESHLFKCKDLSVT